ncbi:MAG: DUF763 domain-containing protein [Candidatus Micrarchaeia archaeon]
MQRMGGFELPLHDGKAPRWLFRRMVALSGAIADVIVEEFGPEELIRRLAHPYWFQAFACTIGFDWHSSGTTTTACGALKLALKPELHGVGVAGGKGKTSKKAPSEIEGICAFFGIDSQSISRASRMVAKVDSACVQDSFSLYHHSIFISEKGAWAVVQQGMNGEYARRYHWLSGKFRRYTEEPHVGICCDFTGETLDLTSRENEGIRKASLDMVRENPMRIRGLLDGQQTLFCEPFERMPNRHEIRRIDISERGWRSLQMAYEIQPEDYDELVSLRGIGGKCLRALALVSELVFGEEISWRDPAKYSFAHGGKDGIPYPVDRETYANTIKMLRDAVESAEIGRREKLDAIRRLSEFTVSDL